MGLGTTGIDVIDPAAGASVANIAVGNIPIGMAAIGREAWVSNAADNTISKVDLDTNTTIGAPFPVAQNPRAIVVLDGALYYASAEEGIIQAIDPANNALGFSLPFPGGENANLGQLVTVDDRLYAGGLNEVFEIAFCASPSTTTTTTPGSSPATPAAQPARAVTGTTPSFTG
jgi:DNA-binding beta-propeller fold protein YncE